MVMLILNRIGECELLILDKNVDCPLKSNGDITFAYSSYSDLTLEEPQHVPFAHTSRLTHEWLGMQVNYRVYEVSTLEFLVKQTCDSVQYLQGALNIFRRDSRLMLRSRSPSKRLEEATVCSIMDKKASDGSLIDSIFRKIVEWNGNRRTMQSQDLGLPHYRPVLDAFIYSFSPIR
jgi:hypothetical protein